MGRGVFRHVAMLWLSAFRLYSPSSREELKDRHMNSPYHRRPYQLTQNDSQDASAEQRYTPFPQSGLVVACLI